MAGSLASVASCGWKKTFNLNKDAQYIVCVIDTIPCMCFRAYSASTSDHWWEIYSGLYPCKGMLYFCVLLGEGHK